MVAWEGAKIHVLTHGLRRQTPSSKASAPIDDLATLMNDDMKEVYPAAIAAG
ncbi:hypothetical protein ACC713_10010 [Rhizobium johnstonii]|uniref:hypothetical protein n=1 Tax=Rhizobium johnstonii TaxID=3019933 RepID=UPI003F9A76D0